MEIESKNQIKCINILSRMQKNFSFIEGFFLTIRLYLTNNIIFYSIGILLRFIPLIIISGDFMPSKVNKENNISFCYLLKKLLLYNSFKNLNISLKFYLIVYILFYALFCLRLINYFYIIQKIKKKNFMNEWPSPTKYQIIMDHIILLFLPYIIEFLSFPHYIYFFSKDGMEFDEKIELFFIMIVNTLLILWYNFNIYILIICSNKRYTVVEKEVYSIIKNNNKNLLNKNAIVYKCNTSIIIILVILQNSVAFQNLENYFNLNYKQYYRAIILIILLLLYFIVIIKSAKEYNYNNFINSFINTLFLFCFYTIILEALLFAFNYVTKNIILDFFFILMKIFLSYVTNLLIVFKLHNTLEKNLNEILFKEKLNKRNYFIDSFLYLNELIQEINKQNNSKSCILILSFLAKHIKICSKTKCNCILLKSIICTKKISDIINILNYLFESAFLEYNYYNNYEMNILLAEHFCHMKNNPMISFSLIKSYIINNKNELSKFKIIDLYELCQKYVYYISAMDKCDKNRKIFDDFYLNYYKLLKMSYKVQIIMNYYIENILIILKYKNIFEENLDIKYDENNEFINTININFFQQKSFIENDFNVLKSNKIINNEQNNFSNLYKIIQILKYNQKYYDSIIAYIKLMSLYINLPMYIIYKFNIFFDIFEGGNIPKEISTKLYFLISYVLNTNKTKNKIYELLKKRYNEQNNRIDSKFYAIYEYKCGLITKYFNEECSLRLGFKQKDIINKKIDVLMPHEFSKTVAEYLKDRAMENKGYINPDVKYQKLLDVIACKEQGN